MTTTNPNPWRPPLQSWRGYAAAILAAAATVALTRGLRSPTGSESVLYPLLLSVIVSGGLGGLGPAMAALGLSLALAIPAGLAPVPGLAPFDWGGFLASGALVSLVTGTLHRAWAGARGDAIRAREVSARLESRLASSEAVRDNQDRLRMLVEQAPIGIALLDQDMVYLATSLRWQADFGRGHSALVGRSHYEIHPDLPEAWRQIHRECLAGAIRSADDDPWVQQDGSEHWFRWAIHPWRDGTGEIGGLIVLAEDVTPRKRADLALRRSEQRYRDLVHLSPSPVLVDRGGAIAFANPAAVAFFGAASPEDLVGRPMHEMVHPGDIEAIRARVAGLRRGEAIGPTTYRALRRDGTVRQVEGLASAFTDDTGPAIQVVIHDITELEQAKASIRERELRLAAVVDSAMDGIITIDEHQRIELINPAAEAIFGHRAADLLGQPIERLLPARFHAEHQQAVARFGTAGTTHRSMGNLAPVVGLRANGDEFPIEASISQTDLGGRKLFTVILRDLTERRRTEEALFNEEARFRQLADSIREVFWLTDIDKGRVIYVSPAYESIWGRSCDGLYQSPLSWLDPILPAHRDRVMRAAANQATGGYNEEYQIARPDGTVRWIHDQAYPVHDANGRVVRIAGVAEDVTARRELEEQLRQTQRMESIGQLAGGVAHDFNNLLTVIAGSAELLAGELTPEHRGHDLVQEIQHAGRRAAALTRQLLAFSRQEVVESRLVDLAEVVTDTDKMLRRLIGEDVTLVVSLVRTPCRVRIDPGQWAQVLLNLAVNARDAMPKGGRLEITTAVVDLNDAYQRVHPTVRPGRYVKLTVTDTGSGMSEEVRSRAFEPFFTTKPRGQGTGLGLAVVHGIVHQSGGHVEASSEVGVGSTLTILLPLVDEEAPVRAEVPKAGALAGLETVLLVEDDESVRRIATRTLQANGYRVIGAADGEQALRALTRSVGRIALTITDVVMPNHGRLGAGQTGSGAPSRNAGVVH